MLGLYLDTLIIGQNVCNIFSVLNELTLQKELGEKKKYVWFRWPDPTYIFRPTLNFFCHLNTEKNWSDILRIIQENI